MRQKQHTLEIVTRGPGLYEISAACAEWLNVSGIDAGLLTIMIRHTSASLVIQENADPAVQHDLEQFFRRIVSRDPGDYRHGSEGPDDMPAHIRSALTQTNLSIPIADGHMQLGTWQGIYLWEHRDAPHTRRMVLHLIGE